jgi:hypothetical protein
MEGPITVVQSTFAQIRAENIERDKKTKEVRRASLIVALLDALDDVCPIKELCALIADFVPLDWHLKQRAPSPLDSDVPHDSLAVRAEYEQKRAEYEQKQSRDREVAGRVKNILHVMGFSGPKFHFLAVIESSECNRYHAISFTTHRDEDVNKLIAWKHEIQNVIGLVDFECTDQPIVLLAVPFMRNPWTTVIWDQSSLHFLIRGGNLVDGQTIHTVRGWVCPRSRTLAKITEFPGVWSRITHSGVDLATTWEDGEENVYLCEFLGVRRRALPPLWGFPFSDMRRTESGIVIVPRDPLRPHVHYQLAMLCGSGVDLPPEGQAYFPLVFPL